MHNNSLLNKIDTLEMAVLIVDSNMNIELVNHAFGEIWDMGVAKISPGDPFRKILDMNRRNGMEDLGDEAWEDYVSERLDEIAQGNVAPCELMRQDDFALLYSISNLSNDRRMISYFELNLDQNGSTNEAQQIASFGSLLDDAIKALETDQEPLRPLTSEKPKFPPRSTIQTIGSSLAGPANHSIDTSMRRIQLHADPHDQSHDKRDIPDSIVNESATTPVSEASLGTIVERVVRDEVTKAVGETLSSLANEDTYDTQLAASAEDPELGSPNEQAEDFGATAMNEHDEQSKLQLKEAIESLEDGFCYFDADDKLIICNDAFKEQFQSLPGAADLIQPGVTYREMTLHMAHSGIVPGIEGKEEEFVESLIEKRRGELGLEKVFQTHDGRWIKQRDVMTESGGIVGVRIDVSELKDREIKLDETYKILETTTKSMPQGVLIVKDDKVASLNDKFLEIFDLTNNEVYAGQGLNDFLDHHLTRAYGENAAESRQRIINNIQSGTSYRADTTTVDGKTIRIDATATDDDVFMFTYSDITKEINLIDQLTKSQSDLANQQEQTIQAMDFLAKTSRSMPQGLVVLKDRVLQHVNPTTLSMMGISEEDAHVGQRFEDYIEMQVKKSYRDVDSDFIEKAIERISSETAYSAERKIQNGKTVRVEGVPESDGVYLLLYSDITEIKDQQRALEELVLENEQNNQRFEAFAKANSDWFWEMDSDLRFSFISEQCAEFTSIDPSTLIGKRRDSNGVLRGVDEQTMAAHIDDMENHRPFRDFVYEATRSDGRTMWISVSGNPFFDQDGNFAGYLGGAHDATERVESKRELQRAKSELEDAIAENEHSKERFKSFAQANSDWFWEMDSELRFSYFSDTFEAVSGVSPEQLLGKTRPQTNILGVKPDDYQAHLTQLENREPFRDFTHAREKADGTLVWLAISGVPIYDSKGNFEGYVGAGRDVSSQVEKQKQLEEAIIAAETAERAKSEFLANMSHEIRTPMNGVMGMAELLTGTDLDSKQKMFTDVIVKSGASLLTIINDILDFSKLDAGQLDLDPAPFNLAESIEDVATLISAKVAEKDLELIVRVDPSLPDTMVGDVGRLRQVMTNLMGNAVKFTEKGHVYVNVDGSVDESGMAKLKFAVEDTGIGIPQEQADQVFKKFNQVDTSATRKHEGTGLGLSIASSLIALMGGQIKVNSVVGQGSTFWFEIELPSQVNKRPKAQVIPGELTGSRILIIDDNGVNRSILTEQMAAWNFDSAAASSGGEGLRMVETIIANKIPLDLIVLDYQMPVMSGGEVLEKLRSNPATADIPVLMLTSVDSSQSNRELNNLGVEGNLTKPARSSLLLETILQIIANKRAEEDSNAQNSGQSAEVPNDAQMSISDASSDETQAVENSAAPMAMDSKSPNSEKSFVQPELDDQLDILVAEDNEVNQIVFTQILEETGLKFKIVENGRLAFAACKARNPKLILMDVSMPEMNGKEATRAIREHEKANQLARVPIVGVTAHALKGDMEACLDAGMNDYLSKPVSPNKLVRKIEQWLKLDLAFARSA